MENRYLEPDADTRKGLLSKVIEFTEEYIKIVEENNVKPYYMGTNKGSGLRASSIHEHGADLDDILTTYKDHVLREGLQMQHGHNFVYQLCGSTFSSALASYLASRTNPFPGQFVSCPGAVRMENMIIEWAAGLMGFPKGFGGNITSGGSMATLLAITAARENANVLAKDFHRLVIYATRCTNSCLNKALLTIGLKEAVIRNIPIDSDYQIDTENLRKTIERDTEAGLIPFLIGASIGRTVTGSVDPIGELADIAHEYNVWLHVDAAYGGFLVLAEELKSCFKDVYRVDSIIMDPHKALFVPFGHGIVILKNGGLLKACYGSHKWYFDSAYPPEEEDSPLDLSIETSKPFRALTIWLPLKLHGVGAFRSYLQEKVLLARYLFKNMKETPGFCVGPYPHLTVVLFKYDTGDKTKNDKFNRRLQKIIMQDYGFNLSANVVNGEVYIRACVLNMYTNIKTVDKLISSIKLSVATTQQEFL
ncbi:aromatic-L-amino-acid decarboxylase-like [Saccoglossus kowalevskii]|uniref:Tyrosine decarboxylase 1-like n=1 Tax=Saccoglossus kowalevskii TaxID=10224 RepID=A0ABM0GKA6_SACKO|nr:PREDICTED: tyrosine decarboxylase 1-like [Saccoglossus kowalevskii]